MLMRYLISNETKILRQFSRVDEIAFDKTTWKHFSTGKPKSEDGRQSKWVDVDVERDNFGSLSLMERVYCFVSSCGPPRGNGGRDSALACCAGGPGLIPAIGKSKKLPHSDDFLSA